MGLIERLPAPHPSKIEPSLASPATGVSANSKPDRALPQAAEAMPAYCHAIRPQALKLPPKSENRHGWCAIAPEKLLCLGANFPGQVPSRTRPASTATDKRQNFEPSSNAPPDGENFGKKHAYFCNATCWCSSCAGAFSNSGNLNVASTALHAAPNTISDTSQMLMPLPAVFAPKDIAPSGATATLQNGFVPNAAMMRMRRTSRHRLSQH